MRGRGVYGRLLLLRRVMRFLVHRTMRQHADERCLRTAAFGFARFVSFSRTSRFAALLRYATQQRARAAA